MRRAIEAILCLTLLASGRGVSSASINTGADFKKAIYTTNLVSRGCIRLLNSTGTIGCSSHQTGTLVHCNGDQLSLTGPSVLVTDESNLAQLLAAISSAESGQSNKVSGVLVVRNATEQQSNLDSQFPQAQFALYHEKGYAWNSRGSGHMWLDLPFSIQYVAPDVQASIIQKANSNAAKEASEDLNEADMDATMFGVEDSQTCLSEGRCDPLGGHSVLGWMPHSTSESQLPVTLLLAQTDGLGLVHDDILGADSPLSGLVAMLAGLEALAIHTQQSTMKRRVAFAALAGEPWGFMGSKRLLWELSQNTSSVHGLTLDHVDQVIEIGSVGRIQKHGSSTPELFLHSQRKGSGFGETSALLQELVTAGASLNNFTVREASKSNPGIPPSSLSSFLRVKPSISGVVLAEFDQQYSNPQYATSYDGLHGINTQAIASTALLLAQALATQAGQPRLPAESAGAILSRVKQLLHCLAKPGSLLRCSLADQLITTVGTQSNYVGVLHTLTKDPQDPNVNVKNDMSRFIWNFLANATSGGKASTQKGGSSGCHPSNNPCQQNAVCVGYRVSEKESSSNGQCQWASVRFVASHSTAIQCKDCDGNAWGSWSMTNASQSWESQHKWPSDPLMTESRWNDGTPSYQVYQRESRKTQARVLIIGAVVTLIAVLLAQLVRRSEPSRYHRVSERVKAWL